MSTSTDITGRGMWMRWIDNGTRVAWTSEPKIEFIMAPVLQKPLIKNKAVEKKIKRKGWSKQFYEK